MTTDMLRILVFPEADLLIGQCLEHDICVRGENIEEVRRRMGYAIEGYQSLGLELASLPCAPAEMENQWQKVAEPPFRMQLDSVCAEFKSAVAA